MATRKTLKDKPITAATPKRAARSDARSREEIIEAAARAFMNKGFDGSSIDMVADELGCTKGPIYYNYKSKADLFFAVQQEGMRMNMEAVRPLAMAAGPAGERLQQMVERQVLLIMSHLPFQRVMVQGVEMHLEGSTTVAQRETLDGLITQRDDFEKLFVRVVKEGVKSGEFGSVDPGIFVKVLLGSITWMTMWYRPKDGETQAKRTKLAKEITRYALNGLQPD